MDVLWTIPVQLQGSWVTLLAVIVIQEVKKLWKRAGFYPFCVLMHWYLLSREPIFTLQYCSPTGILPANAESGCISTILRPQGTRYHLLFRIPSSSRAELIRADHEIGLHGYSHENPIDMSMEQKRDILDKT